MKNNIINIIVGCIAIGAAVFAVVVVVGGHRTGDGGAGSAGGETSGLVGAGKAGSAAPDEVLVAPAPNGDTDDEVVTDQTDGYSFTMPTNWYLEPNAGAGVTIYPDYDPGASDDQASCKIEIAELAGDGSNGASAATDLNDWITAQLHADPTADVTETARTTIRVGLGSGDNTSTAIEWQGALNGVSTTLVYALAPDGSGVLEFAPSTLADDDASEAGDGSATDDCTIELQALLANLNL
jgi:hypothetical protein